MGQTRIRIAICGDCGSEHKKLSKGRCVRNKLFATYAHGGLHLNNGFCIFIEESYPMKTENKYNIGRKVRSSVIAAFSLYFCCVVSSAFGQQNSIYLEAASKGPLYSINYDRIFRQGERTDYSFRLGFSFERDAISIPVGFNFISGHDEHHAEFSFTVIPYFHYYDKQEAVNYTDKSDKYIYLHPGVGYRFQKPERSLFLKAAVGPSLVLDPQKGDFWNMDPKVYFFGSVGGGISF